MFKEFDFIQWIQSQQSTSELVRLSVGDDLAVLNWPGSNLLLVGVDQVLDGVHFDSAHHSPRAIGRKAMNRNISDCAAMACLPAAALVSVVLPSGSGETYARELYLGIKEAGDEFGCEIVGGDTGSWSGKLVVTVTVLGRSAGLVPVPRSGAKPGDQIFVTGPLGGSILGRHMTFQPRVELARHLAAKYNLHAMVDLSDGLGRDLRNICLASGVGACLNLPSIPVHADVMQMNTGRDPISHTLSDGEDYELLIVSPDVLPSPCVVIGSIEEGHKLQLETAESLVTIEWSKLGGWEHSL